MDRKCPWGIRQVRASRPDLRKCGKVPNGAVQTLHHSGGGIRAGFDTDPEVEFIEFVSPIFGILDRPPAIAKAQESLPAR